MRRVKKKFKFRSSESQILGKTGLVLLALLVLTRDKNARTPYDSLYIFQTTCTIIMKFSGSNLFYVSVKKIKNLKILLFLNSTGYAHVPNMSVNKFSTFLYIKIFIVSIGLFVSYLILEFLIMFTYDLS